MVFVKNQGSRDVFPHNDCRGKEVYMTVMEEYTLGINYILAE